MSYNENRFIRDDHIEDFEDANSKQVLEVKHVAIETKPLDDFDIPTDFKEKMKMEGWSSLFPIQYETFNLIRQGLDVVGKDRTGTGKTLAFALPTILNLIDKKKQGNNNPLNAPSIGIVSIQNFI